MTHCAIAELRRLPGWNFALPPSAAYTAAFPRKHCWASDATRAASWNLNCGTPSGPSAAPAHADGQRQIVSRAGRGKVLHRRTRSSSTLMARPEVSPQIKDSRASASRLSRVIEREPSRPLTRPLPLVYAAFTSRIAPTSPARIATERFAESPPPQMLAMRLPSHHPIPDDVPNRRLQSSGGSRERF